MKRDIELMRKIMMLIEQYPNGSPPTELHIEGYTQEQIGYHAYLIVDSGLAAGAKTSGLASKGPQYRIIRLTSAGHDFVESARNPYVWDEVMENIKKQGLTSAAIDVVKKLLDKAVRKKLKAE
jgi:hypothetical protein